VARHHDDEVAPTSRRERRAIERSEQSRTRSRGRPGTQRPAWRSPFALVSIGAIAVAIGAIAFLAAKPPDPEGEILRPAMSYPVDMIDGASVGRIDAPVVIEVYSDFQCPVCGRFAMEYLPRLVADFVRDGRLRIVSSDIAILDSTPPKESLAAATAAACAGAQGLYWQFHDVLFWNQAGENLGGFRPERLAMMADAVGLDRRAWDLCIADSRSAQAVQATTAAALALGVNATPTLSINGELVRGLPQSYDALASLVVELAQGGATPSAVNASP
jgi:protein-disulfide isomerase